jgi:hypothetical protein
VKRLLFVFVAVSVFGCTGAKPSMRDYREGLHTQDHSTSALQFARSQPDCMSSIPLDENDGDELPTMKFLLANSSGMLENKCVHFINL